MANGCGAVIVNADDWGQDAETTDRSLECALRGTISSVSAMVFMKDSQRAASIAAAHHVDTGLHLNLTDSFSGPECPGSLAEHQRKIMRFLRSHRLAQVVYNPLLARSFDYSVRAQLEEYRRLFGAPVKRVDGHHHMHLCANVVAQKLLPAGAIVRRNFSFWPGEKSFANRAYRHWQDRRLALRHRLADYLFPLSALEVEDKKKRIVALTRRFNVEIETHPVNAEESSVLNDEQFMLSACGVSIAHGYVLQKKIEVSGPETTT